MESIEHRRPAAGSSDREVLQTFARLQSLNISGDNRITSLEVGFVVVTRASIRKPAEHHRIPHLEYGTTYYQLRGWVRVATGKMVLNEWQFLGHHANVVGV
jgi:hypothetical protein